MFKKNCLALLSLGLFSSFANASAYSDKLAEMQVKFEQALKGDQAAAAYVCRQGNLPQLKVRLIDRDKHIEACRLYAKDIAKNPSTYRWFMEWSMHLPHELIAPVFKHLTDADIYPVTKINFLFASWLYGEKKNMAGLSESESLKLYRQWVFDNYKAGHPGFAGLYAFLKTEKNGKSSLPAEEIDEIIDNCLQNKDFESLKLFYSRLGEGNYALVEKKLNGKPTHSSLDIARALTQDKLQLTAEQFAAIVKSAVESADAMTLDSDYTTLCKIALEVNDKSIQKTLFEKMLAYRIDPAKIAGAMDAATLENVVKPEFNKDGWAEAAMASLSLSTDHYHEAIDYFKKATALGFSSENMLYKLADSLFHDAKGKVSAQDTLSAHLFLSKHFFYPFGDLGMSFELYQLEKFAKASGQEHLIVEYYQNKFDHASSAKESMELAYRTAKSQIQYGFKNQDQIAASLEQAYADLSRIRFIVTDAEDDKKKPSAAQSIANGFIDASLFGINCDQAVKWYQRTLSGSLQTTDPKDLAAVYQDMGRCYLWAPEGDALARDPIKAREALEKAYAIVEKGDFPVYRGEMPHPARLQEIASLITDSCLESGDEKSAADWAQRAVKLEFGTNDVVAADTAYSMGLYFDRKKDFVNAEHWYGLLKEKSSASSDTNLANLYFNGKDYKKAAQLYTSAFCKAPKAMHANNLALVYAEGKGVNQNLSYAYALYALADDKRARHGMMMLDDQLSDKQKSEVQQLNIRQLLCR